MNRTTVLLVEDHMIVREGLRRLLELETDLKVIAEAQDGREAIALTVELRPDIVIMDIAMPELNGLEASRQILKFLPDTKIIVLTAHCDGSYLTKAIEVGVMGFILKQNSTRDLCRAIRDIRQGNTIFSAGDGCGGHLQTRDGAPMLPHSIPMLTSREMEVLQLIAEGNANKETAAALGISIKTVEKHRGYLMDKLGIHDTASLTRYAIATGIVESSVQFTTV